MKLLMNITIISVIAILALLFYYQINCGSVQEEVVEADEEKARRRQEKMNKKEVKKDGDI